METEKKWVGEVYSLTLRHYISCEGECHNIEEPMVIEMIIDHNIQTPVYLNHMLDMMRDEVLNRKQL